MVRHKINIVATPSPAAASVWGLPDAPLTLAVYLNGMRQDPHTDYSLSGKVVTIPGSTYTDKVLCDYDY